MYLQGEEDLDRTRWNQRLLLYSIREDESEDLLKTDPDLELVPKSVEKVIIPKLDRKCYSLFMYYFYAYLSRSYKTCVIQGKIYKI